MLGDVTPFGVDREKYIEKKIFYSCFFVVSGLTIVKNYGDDVDGEKCSVGLSYGQNF